MKVHKKCTGYRRKHPAAGLKPAKEAVMTSFTGSPDSVTIADYMKKFQYDPSRKEEIIAKYAALAGD